MTKKAEAAVRRVTRSGRPRDDGNVSARGTIIQVNRADTNTSRQSVYEDEFEAGSAATAIALPPPYGVNEMFRLIERSNIIRQCIEAIAVNTVEAGWEVAPIARNVVVDEQERDELQSFIEHANSEESMAAVMSKVVKDRESVGFSYLEVIRDKKRDIAILRHCPAINTRLTPKHTKEQLVEYDIRRGKRIVTVKEYRRFRRFIQLVAGRSIYFKEFGDPREMNSVTGLFEGEAGYTKDSPATEIIHTRLASNDPYGIPRWINHLPSVIGSREVEEVNMRYFEDNTVPPMMLTVAGGRLTAASFRELTKMINTVGVGKERQNKIMLIEAVGEGDSLDGKSSAIQLKVEKLTSERPSDGLFKEYDESNMSKVRSAFRLPPISVGMSQDVNFATAQVSQFVAESQVFGPARVREDEVLNNLLVNGRGGMRLTTVKLVSRTPSITSPESLIKSLTALNVMGAVTPRDVQKIANTVMQIEVAPYPERGEEGWEAWMDQPIALTIKEGSTAEDGQGNSHDEQNQKDASTKAVEGSGDTGNKQPEHGQE